VLTAIARIYFGNHPRQRWLIGSGQSIRVKLAHRHSERLPFSILNGRFHIVQDALEAGPREDRSGIQMK
jgi:hypothetical protein